MFWARFLIGGLIISLVPWVAERFGPRAAGYVLLLPILTIMGMATEYVVNGHKATIKTAQTMLVFVPTYVVFLALTYVLLRSKVGIIPSLTISTSGWIATLVLIKLFVVS